MENLDPQIREKIVQFEEFINFKLKEDLRILEQQLDKKNTEILEFQQLKDTIKVLKENKMDEKGFKTKVDIGQNIFMQAQVDDASKIMLNVGLGYYVEFTLDEALVLIDVRIKIFNKQIENLKTEVAKTNAHIKCMLIGIRELQGLDPKTIDD
ncbi:protein UXT homolog [Trichogramma pretiosum]|uniref:protein UXT homolog n=1 Tax=Trichogramma pretiosum TaxID=7493 RepID=UPI0006C9D739|nr:protein UXT homolog [Trichogramma pretiosum]